MISILLLTGLLISLLGCGKPEALTRQAPLARYMPADTVLFLSVQLRPEGDLLKNWQRIRDAFAEVPAIQEGLQEFQSEAQEELPFDWKTDVDPWVGQHLAIGIVNLETLMEDVSPEAIEMGDIDTAVEEMPPFILAVDVQDREALQNFVKVVKTEMENEGIAVQESSYAGTTIYGFSHEGNDFFFALREEKVALVSNQQALLEGALEREEPDSLAADTEFLALLDRLPQDGLAMGYAAYERLRQEMRATMSEAQDLPLPEAWGAGVRAAGFTLQAESEGLRVQAAATLDLAAMAEAGLKDYYEKMREPHPGRSLEFMPKEAALAFIGRDIYGAWQLQKSQMQQLNPESYADMQGTLEDLAIQTGLNIEEDILSWMTGEYALFMAPGEGELSGAGLPSFHAGFIFEVADQEKAQQAMDKIENLLQEEGDLTFSTQEIEGVEARVVPALQMLGYLPGYAFVDNFLIIAIDEASFSSAFQAQRTKGDRLASSPEFEQVMKALPDKQTGLFYLDFQGLTSFLENAMQEPELSDFRAEAKPILDLLGGMGIAGAAQEAGDDYMIGTMFLRIVR
jgi:hypothetical protein